MKGGGLPLRAYIRSPSRFQATAFTFDKTTFKNKKSQKKYPEILDFAFLRWYLCSVDQLTTDYTDSHRFFNYTIRME